MKFASIQRGWKHTITKILTYVLKVSKTTPGTKAYKERAANPAPQPVTIKVKFPNVVEHQMLPMIQAIIEIGTGGGRNGIFAGMVDRRTIAGLCLAEIGYEDQDELLDKIYGADYDPAEDVTDQRSQPAPQSITAPLGKALTDLSIPPPLPVPVVPMPALGPAPGVPTPKGPVAPPKSSTKSTPTKKEALTVALEALRASVADD